MARISAIQLSAAAAALLLAGCASPGPSPAVKAARSGFTVGETEFMRTGAMEGGDANCDTHSSRSAQPPEILTPDNPWIGTVGLATSLSDSMRCGLGLEVPNPGDRRYESVPYLDRVLNLGVGAWVSWDF